ncbi:MAG TPA: FliM/FliN family flagellar motor switch protein [Kofleriaceae bacterium]|nr:FliM/FliN family flagellar motor switch protein [Kofleriaceae bacterium]
MPVAPFPWNQLRSASWVASRAAAWVGAQRAIAGVRWRGASVVELVDARRRLNEPSLARVRVRRGEHVVVVALSWGAWRSLAVAALGPAADGELAAPRAPTIAERAFAAAAVADALVRGDIDGEVELGDEGAAAWRGPVLLVELSVALFPGAPIVGDVLIAMPAAVPPVEPAPLATLCATRGDRLPDLRVSLALARGRVAGWRDIAARDVVVVGRSAPALLVGRGAIAVAIDGARAGITVLQPYERTVSAMPSEELASDLDLPLAVVAGDVTMSARALLELTPGQVLSLGRTLGGPVELRAGARTLARGELVEVDGELGVRITELVDAAPAVVATRR